MVLLYDWSFWARPDQLVPPGDWFIWLVEAGRGFGKTRIGAEWIRAEVEAGRRSRLGLIAPTAADARDVMVEGESGILAVSPPWFRPKYEPSKHRLTWPNGAIATTYSADEPDRLRGPQHDGLWADERALWKFPETWDMAMMGLRLGNDPRAVVTTTPKATKDYRALRTLPGVVVTRGTTYDNRDNLAEAFFAGIITRYEGTRLGRQELKAELLEDNPGALWKRENIEANRVVKFPDLVRIVVAIDPSATSTGDEAGVIVIGHDWRGHLYVLADDSLQGSPSAWATAGVVDYHKWKADTIVGEGNNGGEMVENTIRTVPDGASVAYKMVHASRGKQTRAEPISSLYEQNKVHHVGAFPLLEDEMCQWEPGMDSPNRMDALVWGATELSGGASAAAILAHYRQLAEAKAKAAKEKASQ